MRYIIIPAFIIGYLWITILSIKDLRRNGIDTKNQLTISWGCFTITIVIILLVSLSVFYW